MPAAAVVSTAYRISEVRVRLTMPSTIDWLWNRRQAVWKQVEALEKARLLEESQAEDWVDDRPHRLAEIICRDLERLMAS